MACAIAVGLWGGLDNHLHGSLSDWYGYIAATRHWMATGQFYAAFQLSGQPYDARRLGGQLYPPIILYLLVPFTVLPAFLWWAIPIGVTVGVVAYHRPARWTWPFLAFALCWGRTATLVWFGNPGMWVVAAVAAGTVWQWPSVLVLLKPSLFPFALFGIRDRRWWLALAVFVMASLPLMSLWAQYPGVVMRSGASWSYSLGEVVPMLAPLVAWAGRGGRDLAELQSRVTSTLAGQRAALRHVQLRRRHVDATPGRQGSR
jgi:hypothetical protein